MNEADLRKQAWDFFQMQAAQRLITFNFYIALSSLLSGGLAASVKIEERVPLFGVLLGLLLVLFSFVFWKLDHRNRDLIKGAEETLKYFENKAQLDDVEEEPEPDDDEKKPHIAKRFTREEHETTILKAARSWRLWRNHYSYSDCFGVVFVAFGIVGILGVGYSVFAALCNI